MGVLLLDAVVGRSLDGVLLSAAFANGVFLRAGSAGFGVMVFLDGFSAGDIVVLGTTVIAAFGVTFDAILAASGGVLVVAGSFAVGVRCERGVLEVLFVAAKLKFAFERDVTDGTKGCEAAGERNRAFDRLVCAPVVDGFDAFDLP